MTVMNLDKPKAAAKPELLLTDPPLSDIGLKGAFACDLAVFFNKSHLIFRS
jgi:hypothetical protein